MMGIGEGDERCNSDAVAEGNVTNGYVGRYFVVVGTGIWRCARSSVDGWSKGIFQHCWHDGGGRSLMDILLPMIVSARKLMHTA